MLKCSIGTWWHYLTLVLAVAAFQNILPIQNNDKFLTLQAANGNNLQIAGQVEISIKISGCHIPHTFIVLPQLHQNLIVACDFFAMTHAVIDLSKNLVTFYDELLTVPIKIQNRAQNFLVTTKYTVLPPHSETIDLVKTHQPIRINCIALIEPLPHRVKAKFWVMRHVTLLRTPHILSCL